MLSYFLRHYSFSLDNCTGTGDHENYFDVEFDFDATRYTNCIKKAVFYRSKDDQIPLSMLTDTLFLFLSEEERMNHTSESAYETYKSLQQKGFAFGDLIDPKYS